MQQFKLFVTGHKGFETLLFHEVRELMSGIDAKLSKTYGGIEIRAGLEAVYRLCLHSRLANRVFCELAHCRAQTEAELYGAAYQVEWERHFDERSSIAVDASVSRSKLDHGHFVALKTKDAIVDRFRDRSGSRPSVAKNRPDIRIHLHLHRDRATISLDLSGESLHRRGYRLQHGGAPLKEHLAAALLAQSGWDREQAAKSRLVDPMCGAGTFAIEAAMIAARVAPGLGREYFGFLKWSWHDPGLWQRCLDTARSQVEARPAAEIFASDYDAKTLELARQNAQRAGVSGSIEFSHQQVAELDLPPGDRETLVICNPPYGRRLQSDSGLAQLYAELGAAVSRLAPARLAIISANPDLLHRLQLHRLQRKPVRNGPLDCLFALFATPDVPLPASGETAAAGRPAAAAEDIVLPLKNRLRKNARHLQRWAKRNQIGCYRVYDADLPEFAFALDRYQSEVSPEQAWFHLQEYRAPASIDADKASYRIELAQAAVCEVFEIPRDQLFCKTRSRQRGAEQYRKQDSRNEFFRVREGAASLLINLSDYLDSGLFLDHRPMRERIYREAAGKTLLNLFCYTGAAGVQAGLGGARAVLNVDLSSTYLDWARENHAINGLDDEARYRFLRADILELLEKPERFGLNAGYDLIFFDPPSFSNSSSMQKTLDIQRDHVTLIPQAMRLLAADGLLLFSTNKRGFRLDQAIGRAFAVEDISAAMLPEDFKRNPGIHRCWEIRAADREQ